MALVTDSLGSFEELKASRRSRMETYFDILRSIGRGTEKPTRIMYESNLSWQSAKAHIDELENRGLISSTCSDKKKLYQLTEKGVALLKNYLSIRDDLRLE